MEYLFKTELVRLLHIPSIETCTVLNEVEAAPKLLVFNMPGFVERILVETPLDICNGLLELFNISSVYSFYKITCFHQLV